jgi:hypothetical protein
MSPIPDYSLSGGMWMEFSRIAIGEPPTFSNYATTANTFKYVIVNVWRRTECSSLKAQNPNAVVLGYQSLPYERPLVTAGGSPINYQDDCAGGISREEANDIATTTTAANTWWVDNGGTFVLNPFDNTDRMVRLNLPEVQAAWASNTLSRITIDPTARFDGVFADDCNYDMPTMTAPFTTDKDWFVRGLKPALTAIYPIFAARGRLLILNFGDIGPTYDRLYTLTQQCDGWMQEFWMRYGGGGWSGWWYHTLVAVEAATLRGKVILLDTPGANNTDTTSQRSGLAAALMVAHPLRKLLAWGFSGVDYTAEKTFAEMSYAIGSPTGARAWTGTANASGLIRYFTNGVAILNPGLNPGGPYGNGATRVSTADNITVSLTGGPYSGSGRTSVTSATLVPGEGVIMTKG